MQTLSQEKTMLYLTDFPLNINNLDIQEFLTNYKDKIIYINTEQNQKNKDKRKPLSIKVLFKDYESANKCRTEMNLRKIRQKSIRIMWDERDTSIRYNTKNNLFFKGIPKKTTPREVYEYFMQFGDISSCTHRAVCPTQPDGETPNPIQPIGKDSGNNRR